MKKLFLLLASILGGMLIGIGGVMVVRHFTGEPMPDVSRALVVGAWLVAMMGVAFFVHIFAHEGGHLLCGLLSGYRFVSFRTGSITLVKTDGKYRLKRYKIAGTGGQCLMAPPTNVPLDKLPTMLYNAGGVIMNVLIATVALVLWLRYDLKQPWDALAFALMFLGYPMALLNGIPMRVGGIPNDGYNMLNLHRDPEATRGFAVQLLANEQSQRGVRMRDMPQEWFAMPSAMNYADALQTGLAVMRVSWLMDCERTDEALALAREMWQHHDEMAMLIKWELQGEFMYLNYVTGHLDEARFLAADERFVRYTRAHAKVMSAKQRWLMVMALLKDQHDQATHIAHTVEARRSQYVLQGEVTSDIDLMNQAI